MAGDSYTFLKYICVDYGLNKLVDHKCVATAYTAYYKHAATDYLAPNITTMHFCHRYNHTFHTPNMPFGIIVHCGQCIC